MILLKGMSNPDQGLKGPNTKRVVRLLENLPQVIF